MPDQTRDNSGLRVAFVIDDLGYGGAQKQLTVVATALKALADPRVYCISGITDPFAATLREAGIAVHAFPRRSAFDLSRLNALIGAIRDDDVDVVHSFLDASNVYAYVAARRTDRPAVLSLRSDRLQLTGARGWVLRRMLERADAVVANSAAGRAYLRKRVGVGDDRIALVRNSVDVPGGGARAVPDAPMVGFVGRLVPLKRADLLVNAMPSIRKRVAGARLTVVGDGPERADLVARARSLELGDAVRFTGAVADVRSELAGFTCLVLPSEFEGLPNAALEALASGVPVVATPVGDLPDVIEDNVTGRLVPHANLLAEAVADTLTNTGLLESARARGPATIRERFSPAAASAAMMSVYERVRKGKGAR